jgi:CDP-paratose 2-epimerase
MSILDLLSCLQDLLSVKPKYVTIPWRNHDQKVSIADISKANELIAWYLKVSAEEGLRRMLGWQGEITSSNLQPVYSEPK